MTKVDMITWILVVISFFGALYNIKKKTIGFWIWGGADIIFTVMYIYIGQYANAVLFAMYTFVNIYGIHEWSKK